MFRVLYDFNAEEEGELSVVEAEIVKDCALGGETPEGWILVESIASNQIGFVPRNYIEQLPDQVKYADTPRTKFIQQKQNQFNFETPQNKYGESPKQQQPQPQQPQQQQYQQNKHNASILQQATANIIQSKTKVNTQNISMQDLHSDNQRSVNMNAKDNDFSNNRSNIFSTTTNQPPVVSTGGGATLSRSSSRDSLHSMASVNNNLNGSQRLGQTNNSKPSLFSVVQTAKAMTKAVNKFTVNQVAVAPAVKVPGFAHMMDRESYQQLHSASSEYFDKLIASQSDSYDMHAKTLEEFSNVMRENILHTTDICAGLSDLDDFLNEQKRKTKLLIDAERNADVLGRNMLAETPSGDNQKHINNSSGHHRQ